MLARAPSMHHQVSGKFKVTNVSPGEISFRVRVEGAGPQVVSRPNRALLRAGEIREVEVVQQFQSLPTDLSAACILVEAAAGTEGEEVAAPPPQRPAKSRIQRHRLAIVAAPVEEDDVVIRRQDNGEENPMWTSEQTSKASLTPPSSTPKSADEDAIEQSEHLAERPPARCGLCRVLFFGR